LVPKFKKSGIRLKKGIKKPLILETNRVNAFQWGKSQERRNQVNGRITTRSRKKPLPTQQMESWQ